MTSLDDFVIQDGILTAYKGYGGIVTVPDGVTKIGRYAFAQAGPERVLLPESVTEIKP